MSDQKYRQKGYRDSGSSPEPRRGHGRAGPRPQSYGPRPVNLAPSRTVSRCGACGAILSPEAAGSGDCPGCGTAVHACRQCVHFDPGSRFQCTKPVPAEIRDKNARNDCELFALRATVERDASPSAKRPDSARSAFDSLFKK